MKKVLVLFLGILISLFCDAQERELLIIGTMHTVPESVKDSYRPLLDYALEYAPEAIYVEYIHPDDTLSINLYTPGFLEKSDSLRQSYHFDEKFFLELGDKRLTDLSKKDFEFLSQSYLYKKDKANYTYYKYLSLYGIDGAEEAQGNENDDLTFKLAARNGIKYLFPIDYHQSDTEYNKAWHKAFIESEKNGDIELLDKLMETNKSELMIAALRGKLGEYTNDPKILDRYELINSFRFANNSNIYTAAAEEYWEQRNHQMAENIVRHIKTTPCQRNILIVGAGHVISLSKALKKICPDLKVILMHDYDRK